MTNQTKAEQVKKKPHQPWREQIDHETTKHPRTSRQKQDNQTRKQQRNQGKIQPRLKKTKCLKKVNTNKAELFIDKENKIN